MFAKPVRRPAYVVLGMHRSGTSSVAGALARLGAAPPRTLMKAADDNPKGFWESEVVTALNDRILAAAGSAWHDWRRLDASRIPADFHAEAVEVLAGEFGDAEAIVLKDPRICRFYPFWRQALLTAGRNPLVVSPIRPAAEVAASLNARSGMGTAQGLRLWLRHVLDAERASRGQDRHLMGWGDFIGDWRGQTVLMARRLKTPLTPRNAGGEAEIDGFLSAEMRHQKADDARLPVLVEAAQSALTGLAARGERSDLHRRLDETRAAFDAACGLFDDAPDGPGR